MAKERTKDLFSNIAFGSVTESAPNTLTFAEINTGMSVHEKIAWIINRIIWYPSVVQIQAITAAADALNMALTLSNKVPDIKAMGDPSVLVRETFLAVIGGAPTTLFHSREPIESDFSSLPGGGLIISPKPLYLAAQGESLVLATTLSCRIYYTVKALAADEFWELVQASRIVQ